ncbi:hypothetical protein QQ045_028617 [Rhodiola kirilowii]
MVHVGIFDAGFSGSPFTWSKQGNNCIWEWLDRVLLNGNAMAFFPDLQVTHLPRVSSDHCPLLIALAAASKRKRGFKFMGAWTMHDEFINLVSSNWSGNAHKNPLINFGLKLKRLRTCLTKWNWNTFGDVNKRVINTQSLIEELEGQLQQGWDNVMHQAVVQAKKDLSTALRYHCINTAFLRRNRESTGFEMGSVTRIYFMCPLRPVVSI